MPICDAVEYNGPRHIFDPKTVGCHIVCKICGALKGTGVRQHIEPMLTQYCNEALRSAGFSAHAEYIFWHGMPAVYEYDPADDGPECEIITRILAIGEKG